MHIKKSCTFITALVKAQNMVELMAEVPSLNSLWTKVPAGICLTSFDKASASTFNS